MVINYFILLFFDLNNYYSINMTYIKEMCDKSSGFVKDEMNIEVCTPFGEFR